MIKTTLAKATLYIVATPIGNLGDMVPRAIATLQSVALIAAEDTRHSRRLLDHFNIATRCVAYHDHSGPHELAALLDELRAGRSIALISDAGTPLISDPGYRLIDAALNDGITVVPIPGACAAIAALSAAGSADRSLRLRRILTGEIAGAPAAFAGIAARAPHAGVL